MRRLELVTVAVVVVLDQLTKALVRGRFALHESIDVVPGWLSLTRVHNTGAAFGMLNDVDFPFKTRGADAGRARRAGRRGLVRGQPAGRQPDGPARARRACSAAPSAT